MGTAWDEGMEHAFVLQQFENLLQVVPNFLD